MSRLLRNRQELELLLQLGNPLPLPFPLLIPNLGRLLRPQLPFPLLRKRKKPTKAKINCLAPSKTGISSKPDVKRRKPLYKPRLLSATPS